MTRIEIEFKTCSGCGQRKQRTPVHFYRNSKDPKHRDYNVFDPLCKPCKREQAAARKGAPSPVIVLRGDLEIATQFWLTAPGVGRHPIRA